MQFLCTLMGPFLDAVQMTCMEVTHMTWTASYKNPPISDFRESFLLLTIYCPYQRSRDITRTCKNKEKCQ